MRKLISLTIVSLMLSVSSARADHLSAFDTKLVEPMPSGKKVAGKTLLIISAVHLALVPVFGAIYASAQGSGSDGAIGTAMLGGMGMVSCAAISGVTFGVGLPLLIAGDHEEQNPQIAKAPSVYGANVSLRF